MAQSDYHQALLDRLNTIGSMGTFVPPSVQRQQINAAAPQSQVQQPQYGSTPGTAWDGKGNPLLAFGKYLQKQGYRVSEHPYFGGVTQGAHVKNSDHYHDNAIDVNYGPGGTSKAETDAINRIIKMASQYGLKYIWQAPGHYNHAHFYWRH